MCVFFKQKTAYELRIGDWSSDVCSSDLGAPADLFISADEGWMDYVAQKGLIQPQTRTSFLANSLVLFALVASRGKVTIHKAFGLAGWLGYGRLAMADPDAVPPALFGKADLRSLRFWATLPPKWGRGEKVGDGKGT